LFFLRGVAPKSVKTLNIYKGVIPYIFIQLFTILIVFQFPEFATWLPRLIN
jgi:TRAP-type mannitol/chloroaromatic compound transport system permease large subunit